MPNLYVFDGSVWPTSAGMNPTATIAALALRFTEQLIESARATQKVAAMIFDEDGAPSWAPSPTS